MARGRKKGDYGSRTMRIPDPIRPLIQEIVDNFYRQQKEVIADKKSSQATD